MNTMIEFAKDNRTTTYFENRAILEIRIAYKVMEYLAPDEVFKPEVNQFVKELMLKEEFSKVYECVLGELDSQGYSTDLGCSAGAESLEAEAIALMAYLLPLYKKHTTDKKEQRRIKLLEELKELEGK